MRDDGDRKRALNICLQNDRSLDSPVSPTRRTGGMGAVGVESTSFYVTAS